jgi:hypothetical protein
MAAFSLVKDRRTTRTGTLHRRSFRLIEASTRRRLWCAKLSASSTMSEGIISFQEGIRKGAIEIDFWVTRAKAIQWATPAGLIVGMQTNGVP